MGIRDLKNFGCNLYNSAKKNLGIYHCMKFGFRALSLRMASLLIALGLGIFNKPQTLT